MKLSKIVTAVFSHSDIIDLLADAVSKETDQMVPPSAVALEVIEGRYVSATVQLTQGASLEEIAEQSAPDAPVEQTPSEAPVADEVAPEETSVEEEAEAALSGPAPEGASDSGVKDPEPTPEPEETPEEPAEEEEPKKVEKKPSGLNFKKTKPPAKPDNEVKPESLFKFAKKK
jgi:chemotaxis protein histidine kinase CheA